MRAMKAPIPWIAAILPALVWSLVLVAAAYAARRATPSATVTTGASRAVPAPSCSPEPTASPPAGQPSQTRSGPAPTPLALPAGVEPPVYPITSFPFHGGQHLTFQASWAGIPAA